MYKPHKWIVIVKYGFIGSSVIGTIGTGTQKHPEKVTSTAFTQKCTFIGLLLVIGPFSLVQ